MKRVLLDHIAFDAGTQIRAALDQSVVADYAEAMTNGATFPPIVLFHDGNQHYLADGFHRFMAAQRLGLNDLEADIHAGSRSDALWFALGANRANGKRLTEADKTHAIQLARQMWPEKMQDEIANQVGCHPSLVSRVYAKLNGSEPVSTGRERKTTTKRDAARVLIQDGVSSKDICKQLGVSNSTVSEVRVELGMSAKLDTSRKAVTERRDRMREMASEGYSSRQIAAELNISFEGCRDILRKEGIDVQADKAVGKLKRHDANRIIEQIVSDAENLTEGVNLIEFDQVDKSHLAEWLRSLQESRDKLGSFIRRLMKEQQKHGEAA